MFGVVGPPVEGGGDGDVDGEGLGDGEGDGDVEGLGDGEGDGEVEGLGEGDGVGAGVEAPVVGQVPTAVH